MSAPGSQGSTLRLEEWLTLLALPVAVGLSELAGKTFDFQLDAYYRFFLPALLLFVVLCPVAAYARRRRVRESEEKTGTGEEKTRLSRAAAAAARDWWTLPACFVIYSNLKVLIPLFRRGVYDQWFLDAETALLAPLAGAGQYPTRWLLEHAGPMGTRLMDLAYVSFFYLYPVSFALVYFGGFHREFRRLLCGILIVYYVGMALYWALPVVGPVYFDGCGPVRSLVLERAREVPGGVTVPRLQAFLLEHYAAVIRSPETFVTKPFLGIAAFPSLHVAHALLFLFSAWRTSRWLFAAYVPVVTALSVSTVFWGFHWALDVVAGACLAWAVDWALGRWLSDRA